MVIMSDYAGSWEFRGLIAPAFNQWTPAQGSTSSGSSLVRLTCHGEKDLVKSFGYIRAVFDVGTPLETRWQRFYFSEESQILNMELPEELLMNSQVCPRTIEVKKSLFRSYRRYLGTIVDYGWQVGIETLEQASLPPEVYNSLTGSPLKILNVGNSGNIIVILQSQEDA